MAQMTKDNLSEAYCDNPSEINVKDTEKEIINLLSEKRYTISEIRGLFSGIIEKLERKMPIQDKFKIV